MKLNNDVVFFTGGGTGGHIYPGLAVADELRLLAKENGRSLTIGWIGNSKGVDKKIVEKAVDGSGNRTADNFYGIPSGKLRRYFSMKNFSDLFWIAGGFFKAYHILRREKPSVLFSKGGFVSVPPCLAARFLKIPVFTHECDFTLGLANRINFKSAKTMFVSYEETRNRLPEGERGRVVVTGNPVRPVFYETKPEKGLEFLGVKNEAAGGKPVLLVLGGSSGAKQINELVYSNIEWLCERFTVVHQTGLVNGDENKSEELTAKFGDSYKPYNFIYDEMPNVVSAADIILSRAGANSICEAAVLLKPMVLVPLCGNGTRGDQVDNAKFFQEQGAAEMLLGEEADNDHLQKALDNMILQENRKKYADNLKKLVEGQKPARKIAEIIYKNTI